MRKVVLTFGLISGALVTFFGLMNVSLLKSGVLNFDNSEITGYGSMIVALSMVFFGIKSFRDKHQNGVIKFGKAFAVGILITLVASAFYVAGWETYYQSDDELRATFMDQYAEHSLNKLRESGATEAQIESASQEMSKMKELYDILILRLAITLVEILPVGLIITLISAAILKKKEILPEAPQRMEI